MADCSPYRPRTVLLLFARQGSIEARHKRLLPGPDNRRLHRQLYGQALATARASGLPVRIMSEPEQQGATFGERITHALTSTLAEGFDQVLCIGSDSPDLRAGDLRAAAAALGPGRPVLGPAADGGVYLIGLHRADFCPQQLARLPWETDRVQAALAAALAPLTITWLRRLTDLDHQADLWQWLRTVSAPAWAWLSRIVRKTSFLPESASPSRLVWMGTPAGRAPPRA